VRLFLAIPLPSAALARLASAAGELRGRSLKAARPDGLHLTLVFLGEREEAEAGKIGDLLEEPELAVPRFPASLGGYGQFPARGTPRVIFTPVLEGAGQITALQQALVGVLHRAGIRLEEEARGFTPHVTLARCRGPGADLRGLQDLLAFEERFTADRLVLYRSILRPEGAEYQALRSLPLK